MEDSHKLQGNVSFKISTPQVINVITDTGMLSLDVPGRQFLLLTGLILRLCCQRRKR